MPSASAARDEMIAEWLRGNEAFKRLARQYGKAPSKPTEPAPDPKGGQAAPGPGAASAPRKAARR